VELALQDAAEFDAAVYRDENPQGRYRNPGLDERRCVIAVDGVVRYVGTQEECERRVAILAPKNDRAAQDRALARLGCLMR
jgi:hypothetical protein